MTMTSTSTLPTTVHSPLHIFRHNTSTLLSPYAANALEDNSMLANKLAKLSKRNALKTRMQIQYPHDPSNYQNYLPQLFPHASSTTPLLSLFLSSHHCIESLETGRPRYYRGRPDDSGFSMSPPISTRPLRSSRYHDCSLGGPGSSGLDCSGCGRIGGSCIEG